MFLHVVRCVCISENIALLNQWCIKLNLFICGPIVGLHVCLSSDQNYKRQQNMTIPGQAKF